MRWAAFRFLGFSACGVLVFFVPVEIAGHRSIPLDHLIGYIGTVIPWFGPVFTLGVVAVGAVLPWLKSGTIRGPGDLVFAGLRSLGLPVVAIAFLEYIGIPLSLGPLEVLMAPNMLPFIFRNLVVAVTLIVPVGAVFLVFILSYGLLEFVGVLVRPVMRPVFRVPGKAAINAVAAFVGSFSVAIFLADKLYQQGVYTKRESAVIMTGFCTVSATFMLIIARTAEMMHIWNLYFWSTLVITVTATAVSVRLWPLRSVDDGYFGATEERGTSVVKDEISDRMPVGFSATIALAWADALQVAAQPPSLLSEIGDNLRGALRMVLVLSPSIASIGLIAFTLVQFSPVFDLLGLLFLPVTGFLALFGMPEPMLLARATAVVLGEMFVPNLIVAAADAPLGLRYVIGVVSVSSVLFFAGSIPCILAVKSRVSLPYILVIWFERSVVSLLAAGAVALLIL